MDVVENLLIESNLMSSIASAAIVRLLLTLCVREGGLVYRRCLVAASRVLYGCCTGVARIPVTAWTGWCICRHGFLVPGPLR